MTPLELVPGAVAQVRQRAWLVQAVTPDPMGRGATRVQLSCIDADAAGTPLEVLWEYEVAPRVLPQAQEQLPPVRRLDPPRAFGAWLHALRWACVTSTDHRLLQAPLRAGIDTKIYQLEPLRKALELPRVNLFIADDVGLGKTIEAGLILQELLLRQRIDRALIVCPPTLTRQWQEEMLQRFGLHFEIYDREFVAARRRERGFSVNPWACAPRFIVSYALLRGDRRRRALHANHLALLLDLLGNRAERSLLILDEAHQAAPSSGALYAIDSHTTRAIREVASRFEHRLFLSATPHNGHSNSFSALLELLDPQRFTRGVPVASARQLAPVMVRRLKRDLRRQGDADFPERVLVDHTLRLPAEDPGLQLGLLLGRYEELWRASLAHLPAREQSARALVCVNLHKRLLSSICAFRRTLGHHARAARGALGALAATPTQLALPSRDDLDEDATDADLDRLDDELAQAAHDPGAEAVALLDQMEALAAAHAHRADPRLDHLAAWIRAHLCPAGRWNQRRVVVFTEYEDTLRWLQRLLPALLETSDLEGRVEVYWGGLGEDRREALQRAFNTRPEAQRLRVLLATDAAREGLNLQAHCHDLFHFDMPWNPARVEQRNGRIDRTLQPAPQVFCHYFDLPDRPEDRVLTHMVRKISTIAEELGSLSAVLSEQLAARLAGGLRALTVQDVDRALTPDDRARAAARELEARYEDPALLQGDLQVLERQWETSKNALGFHLNHLKEALHLSLELACGEGLREHAEAPPGAPPSWLLPEALVRDPSWQDTLELLRPPPDPQAPRWAPRPVRPVALRAAHRLDAPTVQLHLGHPLVQRLLARLRAQGFAHHDLSRVTLIHNAHDSQRRVLAFGRLSLFGHGATRLHEEIITAAAAWRPDHALTPYREDAHKLSVRLLEERLQERDLDLPNPRLADIAARAAQGDFAALAADLQERALAAQERALAALARRGEREADAMRELLARQRRAIQETLDKGDQQLLLLFEADRREKEQFERDRRHMRARLDALDREQDDEPARIQRAYQVALRRFEPLGLVYLWPDA